jgi:hypothetical protein
MQPQQQQVQASDEDVTEARAVLTLDDLVCPPILFELSDFGGLDPHPQPDTPHPRIH